MDLKLYDTLTREKRTFKPIDPANVRMYVCGPTVYDFAHIGNARPVIVFDVLFRLLRHIYGADHVTYVRNITDVDDKINARAAEEYPGLRLNDAIRQVTEKTEQQFRKDVDALGCLPPTVQPRATEHIAEMRDLIDRLVGSGNAYVAEEHVLFFVPSMHDYGKLAKRTLEEMIEGARVEVAPYKRDPMDFVLWKPSKPNEPHWPSPAGIKTPGRPGWHIECSAMSWRYLGEMFDIHGGGVDLVFPHHEDEIAQSRCAFHTPTMANHWMHNGFLQVEGQKMSKSLGNFVTIRDFLQNLPGDVLRLNMLRTHYRHPIDWTSNGVVMALKELQTWTDLIALHLGDDVEDNVNFEAIDAGVLEALFDDLNTPLAISRLHKVFESAQTNPTKVVDLAATLWFLGFKNLSRPGLFHQGFAANLFASGPQIGPEEMRHVQLYRTGVANNFPEAVSASTRYLEAKGFIIKMNDAGVLFVGNKTSAEMQGDADPETQLKAKVQNLIDSRSVARQAKNFAESDRIRNELAKMGVELEDHKDKPTIWKFKKAAS